MNNIFRLNPSVDKNLVLEYFKQCGIFLHTKASEKQLMRFSFSKICLENDLQTDFIYMV